VLRCLLVVGLAAGLLAVPAARAGTVGIFYYPWYGTPAQDGSWLHWSQNGHTPPGNIYSEFYPARGPYSSSSRKVVDAQMAEIAGAGIDEVIVSWWGRGSPEDARLRRLVMPSARRHHLQVAIHLEPYPGRTLQTIAADLDYAASIGIHDVFVYHPADFATADWAPVLAAAPSGLRVFAGTDDVTIAHQGGFAGFYTYDFIDYGGAKFKRLCNEAHRAHILCAPSVGPGYDGVRAGEAPVIKPRRDGATYDALWHAAIAAAPDLVTITSYNEWGEGTQIEPAARRPGYASYDGAWGLEGAKADDAYLTRTAYWAARYHATG
jgi:glycoprotein endo-alpha-1,2-mannosidase